MDKLIEELKQHIIEALNLEDMTPEDIDADAPLFGTGLGLDSIDALELGMAIKRAFGVTFSSNPADNKKIFRSVKTLADFVAASQGE